MSEQESLELLDAALKWGMFFCTAILALLAIITLFLIRERKELANRGKPEVTAPRWQHKEYIELDLVRTNVSAIALAILNALLFFVQIKTESEIKLLQYAKEFEMTNAISKLRKETQPLELSLRQANVTKAESGLVLNIQFNKSKKENVGYDFTFRILEPSSAKILSLAGEEGGLLRQQPDSGYAVSSDGKSARYGIGLLVGTPKFSLLVDKQAKIQILEERLKEPLIIKLGDILEIQH